MEIEEAAAPPQVHPVPPPQAVPTVVVQLPNVAFDLTHPPPWADAILLGFQHYIIALGSTILIPSTLVPFMGGGNEEKAKVIQTMLFVGGINTMTQTFFGTRLSTVIGTSYSSALTVFSIIVASPTSNMMDHREKIFENTMCRFQGAMIAASVVQMAIGFSGLWGKMTRFLSPLSLVPLVSLSGFGLYKFGFPEVAKCMKIGLPQIIILGVFSQYLPRILPGQRHVFERFGVMFSVMIVWTYAILLDVAGAYNNTTTHTQSSCRIDLVNTVGATPWFRVPYPFPWGIPTFDAGYIFTMMGVSFVALVESTGAFIAVSRYAGATPIPPPILGRGVGWQGIGTLICGLFGSGVAPSVSLENAGLIGMTAVGSRRVVQIAAGFMIFFSCLGKFGAIFAAIPTSIIAALNCFFFAYVGSAGLTYLQFCNLNSFRSKVILGFSIFMGLSIPEYFQEYTQHKGFGPVHTRLTWFNNLINVPLSSRTLVAGMLAFVLDISLYRNAENARNDRGMQWWANFMSSTDDPQEFYRLPFGLQQIFPAT
ncbi:nucleobase-ascorbate transporter 6-like [Rutidosis leptorrhynchoides]|uniref:nucleobase-ascorbate transporter 6-like n=1 Tax=Rutidosis leptorrhynchoides TaxID=125765 RepID=UPI003A98F983